MQRLLFPVLAILLASIIGFGALAHALLPHTHSSSEVVTSLLHSALRHEDKNLSDVVPPAPFFSVVVVAAIVLASVPRILPSYALTTHPPALASLRRGIVPYRTFG